MGTQPVSIRHPGEMPPFPYFRVRELLSANKILTVSRLQEIHKGKYGKLLASQMLASLFVSVSQKNKDFGVFVVKIKIGIT